MSDTSMSSDISCNLLSVPLYFSYFIFFSLYLLSFLSPLLITITIALLLVATEKCSTSSSESELDKEIGLLDQSICEVLEPKSLEEGCSEEREDFSPLEEPNFNFDENPVENADKEEAAVEVQKEDREAKTLDAVESNEVEEKQPLRSGSKGMGDRDIYANKVSGDHSLGAHVKVGSGKGLGNCQALCSNLGSFGSIKVANEPRRTSACKQHNADDGSEGKMDMLWDDIGSEGMNMLWEIFNNKEEEEEDLGSEEGMDMLWEIFYEQESNIDKGNKEGKLCCFPALKFSTRKMKFSARKMNLGMGSPILLKFSRSLKDINFFPSAFRNGKMNLGMRRLNLKFSKSFKGINFTP